MADNVTVDNGSGTDYTALTDDCTTGHAQIIKQAVSADGSATLIGATADGMYVQGPAAHDATIAGNPVLLGGTSRDDGAPTAVSGDGEAVRLTADRSGRLVVRPVSFYTTCVTNTSALTTSTTAYTAGDVLDSELSFTNAVRVSGGYGVVEGATLLDKSDVVGAVDLYLFSATSTPAAVNAANSWSDSNMELFVGVIRFPTPDDSALNKVAHWTGVVPFHCAATTLFGVLITRTGHTFFGAASDIRVRLYIRQE